MNEYEKKHKNKDEVHRANDSVLTGNQWYTEALSLNNHRNVFSMGTAHPSRREIRLRLTYVFRTSRSSPHPILHPAGGKWVNPVVQKSSPPGSKSTARKGSSPSEWGKAAS
jgi:hypothetical protein